MSDIVRAQAEIIGEVRDIEQAKSRPISAKAAIFFRARLEKVNEKIYRRSDFSSFEIGKNFACLK